MPRVFFFCGDRSSTNAAIKYQIANRMNPPQQKARRSHKPGCSTALPSDGSKTLAEPFALRETVLSADQG
jgi:hypothetical protein